MSLDGLGLVCASWLCYSLVWTDRPSMMLQALVLLRALHTLRSQLTSFEAAFTGILLSEIAAVLAGGTLRHAHSSDSSHIASSESAPFDQPRPPMFYVTCVLSSLTSHRLCFSSPRTVPHPPTPSPSFSSLPPSFLRPFPPPPLLVHDRHPAQLGPASLCFQVE